MRRLGLIIGYCLFFYTCIGQTIKLKELTGLLDLTQKKVESHLHKKGFKKGIILTGNEEFATYYIFADRRLKSKNKVQQFQIINRDKSYELVYETSSYEEYSKLKEEMKSSGFTSPQSTDSIKPILFQKQNITIESSTKTNDSTLLYVLKAAKKTLPRGKDLQFAEDLLQLNAHVFLLEIFGKQNVKTAMFYYSETDSSKCTVLLPNTNREAIFIWKDETNLKDIAFILIGGHLKSKDKKGSVNQILNNSWRSKQGIYCGMGLREVVIVNKEPIHFYNWGTESAGYLAPKNKGTIDFDRLGIVFGCLNCGFVNITGEEIVESTSAFEEKQKVFVITLIILPEKQNN